QLEQHPLDRAPAADSADVDEMIREQHALLGSEAAAREADQVLRGLAGEPQRQLELHGEVEIHVEELRSQLQGAHVRVEMADVEAPQDRPLDLGSQLPAHLVE